MTDEQKTHMSKAWDVIKNAWDSLDYVPDCPSCKGTGNAPDYLRSEIVYWKGHEVTVCSHCRGRGKV
jgi:DnaJ-class molecular chaperone